MTSGEGEKVDLGNSLKIRGNVEDWLSALELRMKKVVKDGLYNGFMEHMHQNLEEWITKEPAMIVLTLAQIYWCKRVTQILQQTDMDKRRLLEDLKVQQIHAV